MYAQVYHYIDKDGVERYSNEPPPEGSKIIGEAKEVKYDKETDQAQQERNRDAAAAAEAQPALPPAIKSPPPADVSTGGTVIDTGGGETDEKEYSRCKHRRKKEIRKEKAEMRETVEAADQPGTKPAK